jgi:hypothetical protein
MKSLILLLVSFVLSMNLIAQNNPCPDIQSVTLETVSGPPNCAVFVRTFATGDVSAQKGLRVQVYLGLTPSGTPISDECYIVPASSATTAYSSPNLSVSCTSNFTVVITRYTASNGNCGGGTCGEVLTFRGNFGGTLPVALTSFSASRNSGIVSLKWTSESEKDFNMYQVEMNDGNGFKAVGSVLAKNNGLANSYSFEQNVATKQSIQYRLKMIDIDGKFTYSNTALVKGDNQGFDFNIYPNPSTSENTNILVSGISNSGRIQIIDMTGKVLKTLVVNSNNVKVGYLPTGVYMVKLSNTTTSEQVTKRLVIVN